MAVEKICRSLRYGVFGFRIRKTIYQVGYTIEAVKKAEELAMVEWRGRAKEESIIYNIHQDNITYLLATSY